MLQPYKPYFLVKINKEEQQQRKEKAGRFYIAPTHAKMTRNKQSGEIVSIGTKAHELFPQAEVGHTLLFHHFVEGGVDDGTSDNDYLVDEDETYRYYVVTSCDWSGRANETYGVWTGEVLIPHPDYIFLEAEKPQNSDLPPDEFINQAIQKSSGGIYLFQQFRQTREDKVATLARLKMENKSLAKSVITPEIKVAMEAKEAEMAAISKSMNQSTYLPYTIHAVNPEVSTWFSRPVNTGDIIYCKNTGCLTHMEFNGVTFIVAKVIYIGFMLP